MPITQNNRIHLLTERLALCRPQDSDAAAVYEIHADPATNQFNPHGPMQSRDHAVELLENWLAEWRETGWGYWAITLRDDVNQVIGFGGLSTRPRFGGTELIEMLNTQTAANLYFRFRPEAWGKGYASEMAEEALRFGFKQAGLLRIVGITRPSNTPSQKALSRIGLQHIQTDTSDDENDARLIYALNASDYKQLAIETP